MTTSLSLDPTSDKTVKSWAYSSMYSSFLPWGRSTVPSDTSTWRRPRPPTKSFHSSSLPCTRQASQKVPPITTGTPNCSYRRTFSRSPGVTYAVPQPSLTMSM